MQAQPFRLRLSCLPSGPDCCTILPCALQALGYNVLMLPLAAGLFFPLTHMQVGWLAGVCQWCCQPWCTHAELRERVGAFPAASNFSNLPLPASLLRSSPLVLQLPPWVAGACMAFSSVSVVCSSLLLRRYRRPQPVLRDLLVLQR
jgi:hypothetical protein